MCGKVKKRFVYELKVLLIRDQIEILLLEPMFEKKLHNFQDSASHVSNPQSPRLAKSHMCFLSWGILLKFHVWLSWGNLKYAYLSFSIKANDSGFLFFFSPKIKNNHNNHGKGREANI